MPYGNVTLNHSDSESNAILHERKQHLRCTVSQNCSKRTFRSQKVVILQVGVVAARLDTSVFSGMNIDDFVSI